MRNALGLSVVFLMCVVLSSCSGNRPEKAFMGTWEGTHEGESVELSFMENEIWIVKTAGKITMAGTWIMGPEGNAQMTYDDGKITAKLASDEKIIVQPEGESNAVGLDKARRKK